MDHVITNPDHLTLNDKFLAPLKIACQQSSHKRQCNGFSDDTFLAMGVGRVLANEDSGRGFLQRIYDIDDMVIPRNTYFKALASNRRLSNAQSVNLALRSLVTQSTCDDPFVDIGSLEGYDIYAGDGHYINHAVHDKAIDGTTYATGNFFGLNLRTHHLFHVIGADRSAVRKKEHDMRALKRSGYDRLRQGAPHGRKVIWAWDKAGIDIAFWHTAKSQSGIYFVSLAKDNMHLQRKKTLDWDQESPLNIGVSDYAEVHAGSKVIRAIWYTCPISGKDFTFITTLTQIEPGVVAAIYKGRWDIEKVFDETKKKLHEDKSWATGPTAKANHAQMCCITHNLLLIFERTLKKDHKITHVKEDERRQERLDDALEGGTPCSPTVKRLVLRVSQRARVLIRLVSNRLGSKDPLMRSLDKLIQNDKWGVAS